MTGYMGARVFQTSTGRFGRVVQEMNHGFHFRVRWDGLEGTEAVTRVRVEDITRPLTPETETALKAALAR